jgi:hypothetical protein
MSIQTITFECRIAGRLVPQVLELSCSSGFDQINSEATIWCASRPSWADERVDATIWAKNTATGEGQIFGGEITGIDWTYAPTKIGLICGDLLARARDSWGGDDEEYASQTSAAIIRNGLEKNAIPSSSASIEGDVWTVGVINPLVLKNGDDPYGTLIEPLDNLEGYKTYSLSTGVIVRRRVTGSAGGSAAYTFTRGVDILSAPRHNRSALGIVNKVIITGVEYEGLVVGGPGIGEASASNIYVSNVSGFNTERIQSNLVEDDDIALEFAERRVADKNRRPEAVEISIPLDPRIQPGMTVAIVHADLECSGLPMFCSHVAHSVTSGGATTTIRAQGGAIAGPTLQPPQALFAIQATREAIDTGSGVQPIVIIICDGSASFDPDGTIASYAWTIGVDAGTVAPTSSTDSVLRAVVQGAATTVSVTLTVTDNDALTGALSLEYVIDTATMLVEELYTAEGSMLAGSFDGEQTWVEVACPSGNATCLAAIAPAWGQVWGTSTGHIYATFDQLATLVDLGTPHGAVACTALWIHEEDNTRLWAGFSDGQVAYASIDTTGFTATWSLRGDVGTGPINEIRESVGTLNELRATASTIYHYSTDGGTSWSAAHTFATGEAWRMAAGHDQNMVGALGDTSPIYSEVTTPTVPGGVTHLRGLAMGWRMSELYAADNTAQLLRSDSAFAALSVISSAPVGINHMIRSGNLDGIVYLAGGDGTGTNNGALKSIRMATPWYIRKTTARKVYMVGYGSAQLPALPTSNCVTLHVPFDTGTALAMGPDGAMIGRVILTTLDPSLSARFNASTTFTTSVFTYATVGGSYFTAQAISAGVETLLSDIGVRDYIDDHYPHGGTGYWDITFCNLTPA